MRILLLLALLPSQSESDVISVGRENWERPWIPNLRKPSQRVSIPIDRRIDVVILGDGYLASERERFVRDVEAWYARFQTYTPWRELRGAFRVRGVWTPSSARATPDRESHYGLPSTPYGVGDVGSRRTAGKIFEAIDRCGANPARMGTGLTHTSVIMLVRNERERNPGGLTRTLVAPDRRRTVRVGFAAYSHHEFGHSYGGLRDEYIRSEGSRTRRKPPDRPSIFSVQNIAYTPDLSRFPWAHLAPGGAVNPDPSSVIGVLWIGGGAEQGAWHSEGRCLMNGRHENWDLQKTRRGANLRDHDRFCFWCEEILVARTFQKAGALGDSKDGEALWRRWAEEFRPLYHRAFRVPERIRARNAANVKAGLTRAKIFERPS